MSDAPIAEDLREKAFEIYTNWANSDRLSGSLLEDIATALMAEREAGAKAADDLAASPPPNDARHIDWQMGYQDGLMEFAAIRRGTA